MFGEHYYVSGVSNRLDQRQTRARESTHQLVDVVQESKSKTLAEHCSSETRTGRAWQPHSPSAVLLSDLTRCSSFSP